MHYRYNKSMPGVRETILSYLNSHPQGSVTELSIAMQVTPADVRYHLKLLTKSGLLERKPLSGVPRKGRPRFLYSLSGRSLPDNYQGLARAMLSMTAFPGSPGLEIDRLARELVDSTDLANSGAIKLADLVKRLNKLGYQAHWEAYVQGPRVIFRNCPYASLAADFPVLCQVDRRILEISLDSFFSQTSKTALAGGAARRCVFKAQSS
jgi:predicted ArsR family transcriptional regulator